MAESFYEVLDVGRDASQEAIEAAYRERVKETHPDRNDSPDATDAFKRVQAAEAVLGDPEERARYDRLGHASYATRFGDGSGEDGSRWDVGSDPVADDARADEDESAGSSSGAGSSGATGGPGAAGAAGSDDGVSGFGFDPNAYDRTRRTGDGNPSRRSYDVGGEDSNDASASDGGNGADAGTGGTGDGGPRGDARASAGGPTGGRVSANPSWQEAARRTERGWSKATQRDGRSDDEPDGYAVDDWTDTDVEGPIAELRLSGSELVIAGITFLLYPFMMFSAITPQFSPLVNLVVAACVLALTGYLLTMPRVGFAVFGAWSVLAPATFLAFPALDPVSVVGVVVLGVTWIPFGYSVLFLMVLR